MVDLGGLVGDLAKLVADLGELAADLAELLDDFVVDGAAALLYREAGGLVLLAELYLEGATSTVRCVGLRYTVGGLLDDELVGAFVALETGGLLLTGREEDGLGAGFGAGFGAGLGGGFGAVRVGGLGFFAEDTVGGRDVRAGVDGLAGARLGADLAAGGEGLLTGAGAGLGADGLGLLMRLGGGLDGLGAGLDGFGAGLDG